MKLNLIHVSIKICKYCLQMNLKEQDASFYMPSNGDISIIFSTFKLGIRQASFIFQLHIIEVLKINHEESSTSIKVTKKLLIRFTFYEIKITIDQTKIQTQVQI